MWASPQDQILRKLDDLSDRLRRLEEHIRNQPVTPLPYPVQSPYQAPVYDWSKCPRCGIKLDQVMGYVCPTPNCPTGLGGAQCSVK